MKNFSTNFQKRPENRIKSYSSPRIRGDYSYVRDLRLGGKNFSPHTRGLLQHSEKLWRPVRLLPAYAGITPHRRASLSSQKTSPRIRGDYSTEFATPFDLAYFSPHTRGLLSAMTFFTASCDLFPAYAGITPKKAAWADISTSSPRIRGDYSRKTTSSHRSRPASPRIRGDYSLIDVDRQRLSLFSPHTRGLLCPRMANGECTCLLPAYAGITLATLTLEKGEITSPRICGGYSGLVSLRPFMRNFSPCEWGLLFWRFAPQRSRIRHLPATCGDFFYRLLGIG